MNEDENEIDIAECPQCNAQQPVLLGQLGKLTWVRCQACGWDYSLQPEDRENDG